MNSISSYLKMLRGNIPIRQVSRNTEISAAYLSQLEGGKRENPNIDVIKRLAEFYKIPLTEFLENIGYIPPQNENCSSEENIEKAYLHVINDPTYQFGHRIKSDQTLDVKKFIVEMYEKSTGRMILTE